MRRILDGLYKVCAVLAAVFMAAIAVLILSQTIGRPLGVVVPDANELAGFCFAALTFLALAPTFRSGGHIRVTLFTSRLPESLRHGMEVAALVVSLGLVSFAAWAAVDLARGSLEYGDVSPGVTAFPLWIPQAAMAFGLVVLVACLVETLIDVVRGKEPPYAGLEDEVGE
jgi:TRAP-type C4-dicarboxylate transport system permease small subunit